MHKPHGTQYIWRLKLQPGIKKKSCGYNFISKFDLKKTVLILCLKKHMGLPDKRLVLELLFRGKFLPLAVRIQTAVIVKQFRKRKSNNLRQCKALLKTLAVPIQCWLREESWLSVYYDIQLWQKSSDNNCSTARLVCEQIIFFFFIRNPPN